MARQSKSERLQAIHSRALSEFDDIQSAYFAERTQCRDDRRFYSLAGAQWEGPMGELFANKPRYEFNKVHLAVIRIFSEYRNNRITVDFQPKDGTAEDKTADTCDGLYRADEQACSAHEAYDNAFEEGVGGGMGAWRMRTRYENEDDDEDTRQRVMIEPIFDADSCVFFDLGARRYDKSDAKRCYVLTPYPIKAYKEEFDDDPASWPQVVHSYGFDWCTPNVVWVCELYVVEEGSELVRFFQGLDDSAPPMRVTQAELDADPAMLDELLATGFREVRQKRVRRRKIMKYTMSGGGMLTDGEQIPGTCIPIVPFYAKRWVVDGIERCMGHVRLAKDAQRLMNTLLSWLAEIASRFDIEKPILTPEQIAGHAEMWAKDNVSRFPYLLANALTDANGDPIPGSAAPVAYTKAPNIPPAMAALVQIAEQALNDLLGNQQAGEELQPNLSGKAVELIQNRLDMQVFIYMSNLAKSMKRAGEIWLSMMRDIAVEQGRRMKVITPEGEASSVVINQPGYDAEKGAEVLENDLSRADFDVDVDVGPSSTSRRAATVRALTGLMQMTQDPETQAILSGLAMMNMEGEGLGDVRQFFRQRLLKMGAVQPTEEEAAELAQAAANAQPDPQALYLQAAAGQADAEAAQARATTVQRIADADLKAAQRIKTLADAGVNAQAQMIASAQALQEMLQPGEVEAPAVPAPRIDLPDLPGV